MLLIAAMLLAVQTPAVRGQSWRGQIMGCPVYIPDLGQPGKVMEFVHAAGAARVVVANHLAMPWHVAVDAMGHIHVTDEGASQQVKVFSAAGHLIQTLGKRGGRPWAGKYEATNYLEPAGITADAHGGILSAQASLPKVFSRNNAATGQLLKQWFGSQGYWGQLVPSPRHRSTGLPNDIRPWALANRPAARLLYPGLTPGLGPGPLVPIDNRLCGDGADWAQAGPNNPGCQTTA